MTGVRLLMGFAVFGLIVVGVHAGDGWARWKLKDRFERLTGQSYDEDGWGGDDFPEPGEPV